jgi:hypothetical protein
VVPTCEALGPVHRPRPCAPGERRATEVKGVEEAALQAAEVKGAEEALSAEVKTAEDARRAPEVKAVQDARRAAKIKAADGASGGRSGWATIRDRS